MAGGDELLDVHPILSDVETHRIEIPKYGADAFRRQVDLESTLCGSDCGLTDRIRPYDIGTVVISARCNGCISPDRPQKAVAATLRQLKRERDHPSSEFGYIERQNPDQPNHHLVSWESLNSLMPGKAITITRTLGSLRRASSQYSVAGPTPDKRIVPYETALTIDVDLWRRLESNSSLFIVAEEAGAMLADASFRANLRDVGPVGYQLLDLLLDRLRHDGYYEPAEDDAPQA